MVSMGFKLDTPYEPEIITVQDLNNSTIAVDGMNMLYQILYNPYQMQQKLPDTFYLDRTQKVITHLYGWIQKITHFYQAKILPVIIFDGISPQMKNKCQFDKARNFLHLEELYKQAMRVGNKQAAKNITLSKHFLLINCLHESKSLLEMMGVPVIMAPSEAEAQCAFLELQGLVDYVVSKDHDTILYGANHIIRQMLFQTRKKVRGHWKTIIPNLEYISVSKLLKEIQLNRKQLIDYSILVGNDYFPGIPHVGSKRAYQALLKFGTLTKMKEIHPKVFEHLSEQKITQIREEFLHPSVLEIKKINLGSFNRLGLEKLLCKDHFLNETRVQTRLNKLEKKYQQLAKIYNVDNTIVKNTVPLKFDIHIRRRLDRAKTKVKCHKNELIFKSSLKIPSNRKGNLQIKNRRKIKRKTRLASSNQSNPPQKISLKSYFKARNEKKPNSS